MSPQHTTHGRIDRDHYEPSPSTDWRATTRILAATPGADHTLECDAVECDRTGDPVTVVDAATGDVRRGVRCTDHAKHFLEVST